MDKKIGAQLFTIRDYCQTIEDFDESMEKLSKIGYKVVQLSAIGNMHAKEIKEVCDKYGFTKPNISKCLKGERKHSGRHPVTGEKLTWRYLENN